MRPIDICTGQTVAFIEGHIGLGGKRLLEVGCGNGDLALALGEAGHQVIAVDAEADAVAEAQRRGVDARLAVWPDFPREPFDMDQAFDALLFTRSLHHIPPLADAMRQAECLLRPGGLVIVEDFAYSEMGGVAARWFHDLLGLLHAARILFPPAGGFIERLLNDGSLEFWHREHDHDLHKAPAMAAALAERFEIAHISDAPYLYRYLVPALRDDDSGGRILSHVQAMEQTLGKSDSFTLIGRRFVGRKRPVG